MRLKLIVPPNKKSTIMERLHAWDATIESEEAAGDFSVVRIKYSLH
jgi:hypothetical protein